MGFNDSSKPMIKADFQADGGYDDIVDEGHGRVASDAPMLKNSVIDSKVSKGGAKKQNGGVPASIFGNTNADTQAVRGWDKEQHKAGKWAGGAKKGMRPAPVVNDGPEYSEELKDDIFDHSGNDYASPDVHKASSGSKMMKKADSIYANNPIHNEIPSDRAANMNSNSNYNSEAVGYGNNAESMKMSLKKQQTSGGPVRPSPVVNKHMNATDGFAAGGFRQNHQVK
jgi:hypothetical protein